MWLLDCQSKDCYTTTGSATIDPTLQQAPVPNHALLETAEALQPRLYARCKKPYCLGHDRLM